MTESPSTTHASIGIIASAPFGMGAPVIIRTASPVEIETESFEAAACDVATTRNVVGAVSVSLNRTAKPSIAELSNGGSFTFDGKSEPSIRPWAWSKGVVSISVLIAYLCAIVMASSREM